MSEARPPDSSLRTRAKSALIFGPLVLLILFAGGWPYAIMMAAGAGVGGWEWARLVMTNKKPPRHLAHLTALLTALAAFSAGMVHSPIVALWFLLALSFLLFAYNFSRGGPKPWLLLFGVVYVGFSFIVMIWLRDGSTAQGLYHMLTLLLLVWASDISAYFTGRAIGGPKLAPKISPKKTWAGFAGSSVGAGLVAAGLACPWVLKTWGVQTLGGMGPVSYFWMGFILGMFGQAGDLFISLFKRHYGVKDTGTLIPGHGGILDRVDALLLVALFFGSVAMLAKP